MSSRRVRVLTLISTLWLAGASATDSLNAAAAGTEAANALPDLTQPLIYTVEPLEAQVGQPVLVRGVNFGTTPQVTIAGVTAPVLGYRPDKGALIINVPAGAASGSLIVTNTDTSDASNAANFTVLPGSYVTTCTISGKTTEFLAVVPDAVVLALDPTTEQLVAFDVSDVAGDYTLDLPASGTYALGFIPPLGTQLVEFFGSDTCPTTRNHEFSAGVEVSGTVRSAEAPFDVIPNAVVELNDPMGASSETGTDAGGTFSIHVPNGTYDLFVDGPIGGPYIFEETTGVVVSGSTVLPDVLLQVGPILHGAALRQDGADVGPLVDADVALFDDLDQLNGLGYSIVDGRFFVAAPAASGYRMFVGTGDPDLIDLEVRSIDLPADTELPHPLTVYSSASQSPLLPTIVEVSERVVQEGQPLLFDAVNLDGSSVSVRFPDGMGGILDGVDTIVEAGRGILATTVPTGAVSGSVRIRVDGVDSAGYPLTVAAGVFDPGSFTLAGVVSDGALPVADVIVALVVPECDSEKFIDFAVTDAGGNYVVHHATGDYFLFVLPPTAAGLPPTGLPATGLAGNATLDVTLSAGNTVTARVVDSGIGPVGATSAPIGNALVEGNGLDTDAEDWELSDPAGNVMFALPNGGYEFVAEPPFQSRYLGADVAQTVSGDLSLGDVQLNSGFFIEGHVVDDMGDGLAGVEVGASDASGFSGSAWTATADDSGRFRLAVDPGTYNLDFDVRGADFVVPRLEGLVVWTDTTVYPPVQAEPAGHVRGTVYFADGTTPAEDVQVNVYDHGSGVWISGTRSCADGTYDISVRSGTYAAQAQPSFDHPCLADEYFDETYYSCAADAVGVTAPATTTGVDFILDPAGSLSGRIADEPFGLGVENATVCIDEGPGSPSCDIRCTQTDFNGFYFLNSVPVGSDYRVRIDSGFYPQECWNDHVLCTAYDPVPVADCRDTFGLDAVLSNAAGPVADGRFVPGDQMTVGIDRPSGQMTVNWQPTCSASGHVLYYGELGNFAAYTQAVCDIGVDGSVTLPLPAGDAFWVVAGTNGGTTEGVYGFDSGGTPRPTAGGALCGFAEDPSSTCLPSTTVCGDEVREGIEVCDGADLGGLSCESFGFDSGMLGCGFTCTGYDFSDCVVLCGNGDLDPGEECDDNNTSDGDGCQGDCRLPICGDGILDVLDQSMERLIDGGLESWVGGALVDWSLFPDGGIVTQNGANARSGAFCAEIERTTSGLLGIYQSVSGLEPGRTYDLSGWTRVDPGDPTAGFPAVRLRNTRTNEYLDPAGNWGPTTNVIVGGVATDGSWTPFTFRFRTATDHLASDGYQLIFLHNSGRLGSKVYHDDISLVGPLNEECDDGNNVGGDGCEATCTNP